MSNTFDFVSIRDISRGCLDSLIEQALEIKKNGLPEHNPKHTVASLFFEPSTRTRVSFETAIGDLGYKILRLGGKEMSSVPKGESLSDTATMYYGYGADLIVIRHNLNGAAKYLTDIMSIPIINGGDGSNEHPTQAVLDLMTIKEEKGTLDGLKIGLVGDLKYGRTVHSLMHSFELYDIEPWLIAPDVVKMPEWRIDEFKNNTGRDVVITKNLIKALKNVDIVYDTRIQRERFPKGSDGQLQYQKASGVYKITRELLEKHARKGLKVMHPLPRFKENLEITRDVDDTKFNLYFEQAKNGKFARHAISLNAFKDGFEKRKKQGKLKGQLWRDVGKIGGSKKGKNFLYSIENGTLIDHIPAGKGEEVLQITGLIDYESVVHGIRIDSKKFGKKDVIGVRDVYLTEDQLNKIRLVAPEATINYIKDRKVSKKGRVNLPEILVNVVYSNDPNNISHHDNFEHAPTKFRVVSQDPIILKDYYIGMPLHQDEIRIMHTKR